MILCITNAGTGSRDSQLVRQEAFTLRKRSFRLATVQGRLILLEFQDIGPSWRRWQIAITPDPGDRNCRCRAQSEAGEAVKGK
jgi:hypothetical protein